MKKIIITKSYQVFLGWLVLFPMLLFPVQVWGQGFQPPPSQEENFNKISEYLDNKDYQGRKRRYRKEDLAVPVEVDRALSRIGLSHYAILRNELFARHGYKFKNPIFQYIYKQASWYKPDPSFKFTSLNRNERFNAGFIKKLEASFDYENIAKYFYNNNVGYGFKREKLFSENLKFFVVPETVKISLNHLKITPARLLRNEIFARHGYIFNDAKLRKIFSATKWYEGKTRSVREVSRDFNEKELANIKLLRMREWVEILDSVNFTLPEDVISIPALGYSALFIRKIPNNGKTLHYSSHLLWPVLNVKKEQFDDHRTDTDALVSPRVVKRIRKEANHRKKLVLYFQHKKYKGYTDTLIFNHSDMKPPSYLARAIKRLKINWLILLRKEIHARKGAKFTDKKSFSILGATSWYRPRYNLILSTVTRFPKKVKFKRAELINFSLIEGEELQEKHRKYRDIPFLVDLSGNTYFIKMGNIFGYDEKSIKLGRMEPSLEAFRSIENKEMSELVAQEIGEIFNAAKYEQEEEIRGAEG